MKHVDIFTDGACSGNPGPGGWGVILKYKGTEKELSGGAAQTTNNRMEMMAAIASLELLRRPCEVDLHSDSQYLVKAFNDHWIDSWIRKGWKRGKNEPVKNVDLWQRLLKAMEPHKVNYIWVKGHVGNELNERCDQLATSAADGEDLLEDIPLTT
jgi:ribonuclease HI